MEDNRISCFPFSFATVEIIFVVVDFDDGKKEKRLGWKDTIGLLSQKHTSRNESRDTK